MPEKTSGGTTQKYQRGFKSMKNKSGVKTKDETKGKHKVRAGAQIQTTTENLPFNVEMLCREKQTD